MRTRSSSTPDIPRIREALKGNIDTRRWAFYATVDDDTDAIDIDKEGVWLDCTVVETGEPIRVRWGLLIRPGGKGGIWLPPPRPQEEILVVCASGDPLAAVGMYKFATEGDWEVPDSVTGEPDAVHIVGADQKVYARGSETILGDPSTGLQPVGRKEDPTLSDSATDAAYWSWLSGFVGVLQSWVPVPNDGGAALKSALTTYLSGNPVPAQLVGKINGGSPTVKAGD